MQTVVLMAEIPTDPLIANPAFQSRRRKAQQGNPLIV
jgi:hypothetical protein